MADVGPWIAIGLAWLWLAAGSSRSPEALLALPSRLFRTTMALGGSAVLFARSVATALEAASGTPSRTLVVTTIEDLLYGLGVVALGALAAFAIARTLLRLASRDGVWRPSARDVTLRTRFLAASTGVSFATAGVLLDVLVDFELTSDVALAGFLLTAAALVGFSATIGWLVGDDSARGIAAAAAAGAERERMARELHDGVAKSVSVLSLEAATIAARAPEDLRPDLARIERLARLLSEELRAIVSDARTRDNDERFEHSLRRVVDRYAPARLEVTGDLDRIGALGRFEILRIVEEGLRNASRHAGASRITTRVAVLDGRALLEVEDDGSGVGELRWDDLARRGRYGLIGMRERAALLHGTLTIGQAAGRGTLLRVLLPVEAA